jgi:hypothetical protein
MSNITYYDIPQSTDARNGAKKIFYRRKSGNKEKYVYMHQEDKDYVLFWLNRLVCDVVAKQVIDPYTFEELYKSYKDLPRSGYSSKRNSIMTYSAGVVSNIMRNPDEDISYNQLGYIKKMFAIIHFVYTEGPLKNEVGYNHNTGKHNELPKTVMFSEA